MSDFCIDETQIIWNAVNTQSIYKTIYKDVFQGICLRVLIGFPQK